MSDLSKLIDESKGFFKHLFGTDSAPRYIAFGEQIVKTIARQKVVESVESAFASLNHSEPDIEKRAEEFADHLLVKLGPGAQSIGHVLIGQAVAEAFVALEKNGNFNALSVERYINARLGL